MVHGVRVESIDVEYKSRCLGWVIRVGLAFIATAGLCLLAVTGCGAANSQSNQATEHYLAGKEAVERGDQDAALAAFDASLVEQPDPWTYLARAQLFVAMGEVEKAKADCQAGLQLDAEHRQLRWLLDELDKPAARRFRGGNKEPPSTK